MKRFERSYGLDTALYKNYLYLLCMSDIKKKKGRASFQLFKKGRA